MSVALKSNALITEAELEMFLQTTLATDLANTFINAASDFIERFCNRKFISQTYIDEAYDGNGERDLYLDNFPITTLTTVKNWDAYNNTLLYTYTVNLEYVLYGTEGYIHMWGGWAKGTKNYKITYIAGYAIASVPYDLKKACADLCAFYNMNKNKIGMESERIGAYSYQLANNSEIFNSLGIPAEIARVLNAYRKINV